MSKSLMAPIDKVKPNKWNYVTVTPAAFTKIVEQLRRFGFTDPLVVREAGGNYEIVDNYGEHYWRAAIELQMVTVPVYSLGKLSDEDAEQLALALREIHGEPDEIRLSDLLRSIHAASNIERMAEVLPYDGKQLRYLIDAVDFSFSKLSPKDTRPKHNPDATPKEAKHRIEFELEEPAAGQFASVAPAPEEALVQLLDEWDRQHKETKSP